MKTPRRYLVASAVVFVSLLTQKTNAAINVNVIADATLSTPKYADSLGANLPVGALVLIGTFNLTAYNNLSDLNNFTQVQSTFAQVATTSIQAAGNLQAFNLPGVFTTQGDLLYTWVFNTASGATATQWGIFNASTSSASPWIMPPDLGTATLSSPFIDTIIRGSAAGGDYRLDVIPEPTAAALLGLGLLGLLVRRRRA